MLQPSQLDRSTSCFTGALDLSQRDSASDVYGIATIGDIGAVTLTNQSVQCALCRRVKVRPRQ
jgi:hypothetical protein